MMNVLLLEDCKQDSKILIIPRVIFNALSPLDQLAAKALEKCGKVQIVEEQEREKNG